MGADAEWADLMAAAQGGNGGAYRRLLDELRTWLLRYYTHRLPPAMVEDAVQDALVAIHRKRHTYDPARAFHPWLVAVARYKWIDRLRALARHPTEALVQDIAIAGHERAVTSATVLARLLDTLKPAQATVIRLVKLDGCSIEEASRRTGQSPSLVKVNIHRGIARLAALMEENGDVD